jgi:hypothetical protein
MGAGDASSASATFSATDAAKITQLRLQRRPYHWVEFRNISLVAGHHTTVEVLDCGELSEPR